MTAPTTTFGVADIMIALAEQQGINLEVDGIDDVCSGCVISADKNLNRFLSDHATPYNYLILDGDPIRVMRRAINADLIIDYEIDQTDCIVRSAGAVIGFKRTDPATLPRAVEIQYTDPDRLFATSTQVARHPGAPTTNASSSYGLDFIITGDIARVMAFDTLYRIWSQQLAISFEHGDLTIETGDVCRLTCDQGVFTMLVQEVTYTVQRTVIVQGTALLTAAGVAISPGVPDGFTPSPDNVVGYVRLTDVVKHLLLAAPGDSPAVKHTRLNWISISNIGTVDVIISIYDGNVGSPDVVLATIPVSAGGTISINYLATSPDAALVASTGNGIYVASNAVSVVDIQAGGTIS